MSRADRAKQAIRDAYSRDQNKSIMRDEQYHFHLYENDHQERINSLLDDEDGDYIVHRQAQKPSSSAASSVMTDRSVRTIEANDRRHDAIIFGDKSIENEQKKQIWDSVKFSSKYATTSLAGPLLLEDIAIKRQRWKSQMSELWTKYNQTMSSV